MSKRPEGYAPDLFSEHARAAQLGLRVQGILRDIDARNARRWPSTEAAYFHVLIHSAALALGLAEDSPEAQANRATIARETGVRESDLVYVQTEDRRAVR